MKLREGLPHRDDERTFGTFRHGHLRGLLVVETRAREQFAQTVRLPDDVLRFRIPRKVPIARRRFLIGVQLRRTRVGNELVDERS